MKSIGIKELNYNYKAKLDIFRTIKVVINSLLFNIYYFSFFVIFQYWKSKKNTLNDLDDIDINLLKIKMIGSNHSRRENLGFILIKKIILKLLFWKRFTTDSSKNNPIKLYKSKYNFNNIPKIINNYQIIFCGDSHVEFFSRINLFYSFKKKVTPISIWLGPKTLVGCSSDIKVQNWLFEIVKGLENKNNKKMLIIFSIGSIDIRTTFGYLLATKSISSEKDFFDIFERSYIALQEGLIEKIKFGNERKIAFLSLPPVSPLKGINIKNCSLKKAIEYQNNSPFSIFGSPEDRAGWTKILNLRLEKISRERGWNFINNDDAYETIQCKNNYIIDENFSFDNTHITEPNFYAKTLKNIILYFENKS